MTLTSEVNLEIQCEGDFNQQERNLIKVFFDYGIIGQTCDYDTLIKDFCINNGYKYNIDDHLVIIYK